MTLLVSRAYGRVVGLDVPDPVLAVPLLPWWWVEADLPPERVFEVAAPIGTAAVIAELELWVAEHAVGLTFVHAGAVVIDGRALLLPGRSLAGKTTLTLALVDAGASYLSDEYAVLDADGLVHPYPRPPVVRSGDRPHGLAARVTGGPVEVGAIAVLTYGTQWSVVPLTPGDAALALLDNTVSARSRPGEALHAVEAALRGTRTWAGTRAEAVDAAHEVRRLMGG